MHYLVPGPTPCPEVVAVFYIRPAEVLTLFSVEGDAQIERQNTVVGFLTTTATGMKRSTIEPQDKGNILSSNHLKATQLQSTICQGHPRR